MPAKRKQRARAVNWRGMTWHKQASSKTTACGARIPPTADSAANLRLVDCKRCQRASGSTQTSSRSVKRLTATPGAPAASNFMARTAAGGRASVDSPDDLYANTLAIIPGWASTDDYWRGMHLDTDTLCRIPPAQLLELMVDVSPELSRAMFDFLIMYNPGWTVHAYKLGAESKDENAIDQRGEAIIKQCLETLKELHVSPDVVFNQFGIQCFIRGALFGELILGLNSRTFIDIATPDPKTLSFKRALDEVRGPYWMFGQFQAGQFVRLDDLMTVRYLPIHPLPGKIQGRSPANSSLFVCLFLLVMLHDLRRVIQRQGYPRIDIALDLAKLKELMPEDDMEDPDAVETWANAFIAQIKSVYSKLEADEAYIHSDVATVNAPVGAMNQAGLGIIDALFKALERMCTRALKTMPLLMATTDGVSEANANRQWEIHAQSIKSMQHLVETLLTYLFTLACRAQGVVCEVDFKFAELRAAELLRDTQVKVLLATLARALYDNGWISQDEAAKMGADKQKADQPEPRVKAGASAPAAGDGGGQDPTNVNPEPGANRNDAMAMVRAYALKIMTGLNRTAPTAAEVEAAVDFWNKYAPEAARNLPLAETESE
jgi:hypothetical protein